MTSWEKSLLVLASDAGGAEDDTGVAAHAHAALGRVVASSFGATNEAEREGNSHFFLSTLMRGQGYHRERGEDS